MPDKHPHTCGAPLGKTQVVQDGWMDDVVGGEFVRFPRMVVIPIAFKSEVICGYVHRSSDPDCAHCWRSKA